MPLRSQRRFISKDTVQSGMMIEFTYKKVRDDGTKNYTALIIDPNKDNYLHALLIDDLSDSALISLVKTLGTFEYDSNNPNVPITNLQNDEAYSKYLGIKGERRYRTFLRSNISNLRQILIGEIS